MNGFRVLLEGNNRAYIVPQICTTGRSCSRSRYRNKLRARLHLQDSR